MEIYLVGGAVRDKLLDRPIHERDWVVVGASPEEMLALKFKPVGKDFPVFLHPTTHEEYALARTERKTGRGYKGFTFYTDKAVSLEEDLRRRDLTINAMAETSTGEIIDPFGGQFDLKNKILRHVSSAFAEDPVRILRVARFAARFFGFSVHPETLLLMKAMVENGEINALVPERIWQELEKALKETHAQRFFEVLSACHALAILFPELINNEPGFIALANATAVHSDTVVRLAALLHPLSKEALNQLAKRFHFPKNYYELAKLTAENHALFYQCLSMHGDQVLLLLENVDAFRREERFQQFIETALFIYPDAKKQAELLQKALVITKAIDVASFIKPGMMGEEIAKQLRELRLVELTTKL